MVTLLDNDGDKKDVLRQKRRQEKQFVYDIAFGEDSSQVGLSDGSKVLLGMRVTIGQMGSTSIWYSSWLVSSFIFVCPSEVIFHMKREIPKAEVHHCPCPTVTYLGLQYLIQSAAWELLSDWGGHTVIEINRGYPHIQFSHRF